MSMLRVLRPSIALSCLVVLLVPSMALAAGTGPLVGAGQQLLDFLSHTIGPIVFGIGLAIAALSLVVGSRDGVQKAIWTVAGGLLLFSVSSVVDFVSRISR